MNVWRLPQDPAKNRTRVSRPRRAVPKGLASRLSHLYRPHAYLAVPCPSLSFVPQSTSAAAARCTITIVRLAECLAKHLPAPSQSGFSIFRGSSPVLHRLLKTQRWRSWNHQGHGLQSRRCNWRPQELFGRTAHKSVITRSINSLESKYSPVQSLE